MLDLRKLIAGNNQLPVENLRLILRGNVLHDSKNGEDAYLRLNSGGIVIILHNICFLRLPVLVYW